jgi:DNA-binding GntR family transcriptional regulator
MNTSSAKEQILRATGSADTEHDSASGDRLPAPEVVISGLRKAILQGDILPGTQLRQDEIAKRFGTSRIPVREALRQLEAEGLVSLHPNRGALVKTFTLEEMLEVLEIRIGLECRALRLAIPHMVDDDIETATRLLTSYDNEPHPEKWGGMNREFHRLLYSPCNRPRLLNLIEANWNQLSTFTRLQMSLAAGKDNPNREHWQLLELCRKARTEEAIALLEKHIVYTQNSLMSAMRKSSR